MKQIPLQSLHLSLCHMIADNVRGVVSPENGQFFQLVEKMAHSPADHMLFNDSDLLQIVKYLSVVSIGDAIGSRRIQDLQPPRFKALGSREVKPEPGKSPDSLYAEALDVCTSPADAIDAQQASGGAMKPRFPIDVIPWPIWFQRECIEWLESISDFTQLLYKEFGGTPLRWISFATVDRHLAPAIELIYDSSHTFNFNPPLITSRWNAYAQQFRSQQLDLASGLAVALKWLSEIREILSACGRADCLPMPTGDVLTPTDGKCRRLSRNDSDDNLLRRLILLLGADKPTEVFRKNAGITDTRTLGALKRLQRKKIYYGHQRDRGRKSNSKKKKAKENNKTPKKKK